MSTQALYYFLGERVTKEAKNKKSGKRRGNNKQMNVERSKKAIKAFCRKNIKIDFWNS